MAVNQAQVLCKGIYGATIIMGPGDPSSLGYTAPQGALYLRVDGGATTTLYVKTGASDTSWTAK
jgi:hypothetical protein